jgi:trehalose 6-phosphate synthase complex regulatory subunit
LKAIDKLDVPVLIPRYKHSRKRLLLLDFEGTLWVRDVSRAGLLSSFVPPEDAMELLSKLAEDRRNDVWLMSGLPVQGVIDKVAELVPNIGLMLVLCLS